ncbi:MAG TPA: TIR domain-containing protein [Pyrinomonadaceae bacterium]|nr:TIR domain-containing protein [Pyrinomonadaceae bacterium]
MPEYHAFICHATEDKSFVRPLAEQLRARGLKIWYDEFELTIGDSLRDAIDRGLRSSKFGIVVLSRAFFVKTWPRKELDGLVSEEVKRGTKVVLPLRHEISQEEIEDYSPLLASRISLPTSLGLERVVGSLVPILVGAETKARLRDTFGTFGRIGRRYAEVRAPIVGRFYPYLNMTAWMNWDQYGDSYPIPNAKPYLMPGDLVTPNSTIGVISAMGTYSEIDALVEGVFEEYLVPEHTEVEYEQPLARIRVSGVPAHAA